MLEMLEDLIKNFVFLFIITSLYIMEGKLQHITSPSLVVHGHGLYKQLTLLHRGISGESMVVILCA